MHERSPRLHCRRPPVADTAPPRVALAMMPGQRKQRRNGYESIEMGNSPAPMLGRTQRQFSTSIRLPPTPQVK